MNIQILWAGALLPSQFVGNLREGAALQTVLLYGIFGTWSLFGRVAQQ